MAKNIEYTEKGVVLKFGKSSATNVARGHKQHKSGAGTHGQRKKVRVRGNQAKRAWLDGDC